jgi:hypothetical protein
MFDAQIIEQLGHYVYVLIDPRDELPFYIGKGEGNRVYDHVARELKDPKATDKYDTIRDIKNASLNVKHIILKHELVCAEAYK